MWVLEVLGAMWVSRLHEGIIRVQEFQLHIVLKGQLHVLHNWVIPPIVLFYLTYRYCMHGSPSLVWVSFDM
jgi:hypothetical protein